MPWHSSPFFSGHHDVRKSIEDCLNANLNWESKKADCLAKFGIWKEGPVVHIRPTVDVMRLLDVTGDLGSAMGSSNSSKLEEWEEYAKNTMSSVAFIRICIILAILGYFLMRYVRRQRTIDPWPMPSIAISTYRPSQPHFLSLRRGRRARSYDSLPPPAYDSVAQGTKCNAKEADKECPPPTYETALKNDSVKPTFCDNV